MFVLSSSLHHRLMRHFVRLGELRELMVGDELDRYRGVAGLEVDALLDEVGVGGIVRWLFVEVLLDVLHIGHEDDGGAFGYCLHSMNHDREDHAELCRVVIRDGVFVHYLPIPFHDVCTSAATLLMPVVA